LLTFTQNLYYFKYKDEIGTNEYAPIQSVIDLFDAINEDETMKDKTKRYDALRSRSYNEFKKHLTLDYIIRYLHCERVLNDEEKKTKDEFNKITNPIFDNEQFVFERDFHFLNTLEYFVKILKFDINSKNEAGLTPLHSLICKSSHSNDRKEFNVNLNTKIKYQL
jgi:hypothetical protein